MLYLQRILGHLPGFTDPFVFTDVHQAGCVVYL